MKAMILAAGRGVRMRPLSYATPKPLLKIGSMCLIEKLFMSLKQAGICEVVINVSYLAEKIISKVGDGSNYGLKIIYSHEEDGPFGTGGGIYRALPLLGDDPFLVVSGDLLTDFPFEHLVKNFDHRSWDKDAHLILVDREEFQSGDFSLESNGCLGLGQHKHTYASMGVFHPRLFGDVHELQFPLAPLIVSAIQKQRVTGELYTGLWHNIGTPEQLRQLQDERGVDGKA